MSDSFYTKTASNLSDVASASTSRTNLGLGTAATQASSAFDAAGAATAAQAAAIAASLPTLTANVTATSSATLATNTVTECSAGANLTMTLPTSVAGALIVVEKSDSSTNTVAVTGSIRGVGSSTLTLTLTRESMMFLGYASSWWPVAGHKTLGSLDARYANVFSPMAYGAKGDGTTNDTTAVQAAFTAAAVSRGVVDLGHFQFLTTSPISMPSGIALRGSSGWVGGGVLQGALANNTTDLFAIPAARTDTSCATTSGSAVVQDTSAGTGDVGQQVSGTGVPARTVIIAVSAGVSFTMSANATATSTPTVSLTIGSAISSVLIENCSLRTTAGHVFNCAANSSVSGWVFRNSVLNVAVNNYAIWYMPTNGTYIAMTVTDNCVLACNGSGATVNPWYINSLSAANCNWWDKITVDGNGITIPFFYLASSSASSYLSSNTFRNICVEQTPGGVITALTCDKVLIEGVCVYDTTTFTGSLFVTGAGSGGLRSQNITIRESGRVGGALSSCYDVQCGATDTSIVLQNVGPESGSASYSVPAAQTTILGGGITKSPVFTAAGVGSGSNAAARWVGATTTGHPTAGTYVTGDWITTQDAVVWVCTAGGSPGTWVASGIALDATAGDIQPLGTQAAGSTGKAADAGHVHASTSVIDGVAVSGIPVLGNTITATDGTHANWQTPAAGVTLDTTATDIVAAGTQAAGATGKAADAGHVHPTASFFQQFTSSGSVTPVAGTYEITATGAGGGGGGGGGTASATAQAGGGGGGAAATSRQIVVLGSSITLTVTIPTGGAGGAGGVANGTAGSNGTAGASATVTGTGVSVTGIGGCAGRHPTLNSNTAAAGGAWGMGSVNATVTGGTNQSPGCGGSSANAGGTNAGGPVDRAGGGGGSGGSANATTAGGGAGTAGSATAAGTTGTDASSGTTSGGTASGGTAIGAGGGGGGGGAQVTGAGGAGGAGGPGLVTILRVA